MRNIKIAYSLVFIMFLFPFYTKAQQETEQKATQENKQEEVNNTDILIRQLNEKDKTIEELKTQITTLNEQVVNDKSVAQTKEDNFQQEKKSLNESINNLNKEITTLKAEKDAAVKKAEDYENRFKNLDKIIYKQCLYYTLEKPYNPKLIDDAKKCLEKMEMDIKSSHPTEFETYRPFLDTYAKYNSEVKNFLKNQMEILKVKKWRINDIGKKQARDALNALEYYQYYKNKDKKPWKSIVYLDEVIGNFIKLMECQNLNEKNLQELIDKLPDTGTVTATNTKVATATETEIETKAKAEQNK